jgi:hypothetical protein
MTDFPDPSFSADPAPESPPALPHGDNTKGASSMLIEALREVGIGPLAADDDGRSRLHDLGEPSYVMHLDNSRWIVRHDDLDRLCFFDEILDAELVEFVNATGFGFHGTTIDVLSPGAEIVPVSEVIGREAFDDGGVTRFCDVSHPDALAAAQFAACLGFAVHGTGHPTVYLTEANGPVQPWPKGVAGRLTPRQTVVAMIWSASAIPEHLTESVEKFLADHSEEEISDAVAVGIGRLAGTGTEATVGHARVVAETEGVANV